MKIQYQLWLLFSGLLIAVCLAMYLVVSNTYEQRLQASYEQISIAQGSILLGQLVETYPHEPKRSLGYLRAYSEDLDMRLIMLDRDKKVYADSFQQLQPKSELELTILNQENNKSSLFTKTDTFGYVQYTLLPFQTGEKAGFLLMIQEADQLYGELKSFQNWMLRTLLIAILAFFVISYFVSSWFSKPIRQIIFHLKKITPQKRDFKLSYRRRDEIKELIDTLQKMVEELNLYDKRQRRFLSTSSHELKTPLATIHLILENLPYVREKEEVFYEFVQDLTFQVQKMKQMVDRLLQINSMWDKQIQKEKVNVEDIHKYILQSFQHIAWDKQITMDFKLEPLSLKVDRVSFLGAIDNLISNALRYSPTGKTVKIKVVDAQEYHKITVCDQGIGISQEDLPYIFEPFYRSNDATAWNQEGTGLGLTLVKQMVELHKGRIDIDTVQKQGTCIELFLPKA